MKKVTKTLLVLLCAVLLVVGSVLGTLAYLTDSHSATNTFVAGDVDIELDEENTDPDPEDPRDEENEYELIPGVPETKDPTVHVKKTSEDAYAYMVVEVVGIDGLKAAVPQTDYPDYYGTGDVFLIQNLVNNTWNEAAWPYVAYEEVTVDGVTTGKYLFAYHEIVTDATVDARPETDPSGAEDLYTSLPALFTEIMLPGEFDNKQTAAAANVVIKVTGYAIQAKGFEPASAEGAWEIGFIDVLNTNNVAADWSKAPAAAQG